MIPLSVNGTPHRITEPIIAKITDAGGASWPRVARVLGSGDPNDTHADLLLSEQPLSTRALAAISVPTVHALSLSHLHDGDVVRVDARGHVRSVYRRGSPHNALFATDRCNSYCLMCSQPPRDIQDDWRVEEMLQIIELIDPDTAALGITGGEPTLLKDGFLRVIEACEQRLPQTAVHVLSNGRLFRYGTFARRLGDLRHHDLMIGVPLYSDLEDRHDHVVQAKGAFGETLLGLHNLARFDVPVEIRVVVHRLTFERLPQLAEFIYRNLTFVAHVTFMGLELTGFTLPNLEALWIDPWEYQSQLESAVHHLSDRGMHVSIYNHQLCTLPEGLWSFARRSISDWKNEYLTCCDDCAVQTECGGFFASAVQRRVSQRIAPVVHRAAGSTI